jgi:UDP-glucose 4-epimerase
MSRVLVTGGAGFIGSHVVDRLIEAGHEPRILDLRCSPYRDDVETVIGDMRILDDVRRAMEGCDAVAHLAAAADVGEVQQDPVLAEQLNARGTVNVLEAARELGVQRVVYASTIWVYSDVEAERVDEDTALLPPAHLYTATKLAGELYCRSYRELYGVESTILRFGIPYGPRARPAAVIPIFVNKALAGEPLTLAGGGMQSRRFVYVEDLAEGVVRGLAPAAANRTYNLVSDEDVTIRQIAEHVRDAIGNVELVETEGRAGDFKGAEVCGARALAELGWQPRTPFAEGLRRYVAWHRAQVEAPQAAPAPVAVPALAAPAAAPEPMAVPALAATAAATVTAGAVAVAAAAASPAAEDPVAAPPTAPARRRRRRRPAWRLAMLVVVGLIAGALAAALAHTVVFNDPAAIIGTLVLLGIPTTLIARIDWNQDRRDAVAVFGTMVVGSLLTSNLVDLMRDWASGVSHFARGHHLLAVLIACSMLALVGGVRRLAAARA